APARRPRPGAALLRAGRSPGPAAWVPLNRPAHLATPLQGSPAPEEQAMSYTQVRLPEDGYRHEGITVLELDVAVGQRTEDTSELHVRGTYKLQADVGPHDWGFAGSIVLREGADAPDHDVTVAGFRVGAEEREALAVAVSLARDEPSTVTATEMRRICGDS